MLHSYGTIRHILTYFTLLLYPALVFSTGVTFFRPLQNIVYAQTGDTAKLGWVYDVETDKGTDFAIYQNPTWNKIYPNGTTRILMYDDGDNGKNWELTIAQNCPTAYKTRISKEGNGTLVISNVTPQDSGNYSCKLELSNGQKPEKFIELVVSDPSTTASSPPNSTSTPSLSTTTTAPPSPSASPKANVGAIVGGVIGGVVFIVLIVVAVCCYKKK